MPAPKVLIENQNALGKNVEQVSLDTNRLNVYNETSTRVANLIAISSRAIWVDVSSWVVYTAAAFSIADVALSLGAPFWVVGLLLGLPLMTLVTLIGSTMDRRSTLVSHGFFRFFLLFLGAAIAVV